MSDGPQALSQVHTKPRSSYLLRIAASEKARPSDTALKTPRFAEAYGCGIRFLLHGWIPRWGVNSTNACF